MRKNLCKLINPCVCKVCGEEMLFFVNKNNKLIDYTKLFNMFQTSPEIYRFLANNNVTHMKCLVCDKNYIIDWSDKFPKQLINADELHKFSL